MKRCFLCNSQPKFGRVQEANLSYHRFPKNIETRLLWIKNCNLDENRDDVSTLYICSKHFSVNDYVDLNAKSFGGVVRLKRGAVPQTKFVTNKLPILSTCVSEQELVSANSDATQIFNHLPGSSNIANKEHDMCPLVSDTDVYESICTANASSEYRAGSLELPARSPEGDTIISLEDECNPQSPCTPKKRKFVLPRHSGNLTAEDFSMPRKAKRNYGLLENTIDIKQKRIKATLQQIRRLTKKITSIKELLSHLRSRDLITEEAEQTIMVCLNPGRGPHGQNLGT